MEQRLHQFELCNPAPARKYQLHDVSFGGRLLNASYDKELAQLLSEFRELQDDLLRHGDCDSSQSTADPTGSTIDEIHQLRQNLSKLLDINAQNDGLRNEISQASDDQFAQGPQRVDSLNSSARSERADGFQLRVFEPECSAPEVVASKTRLTDQLSTLEDQIAGGEDDLAHAQRLLDRLLERSSVNDSSLDAVNATERHPEQHDSDREVPSVIKIADHTRELAASPDECLSPVNESETSAGIAQQEALDSAQQEIAQKESERQAAEERIGVLVDNEQLLQDELQEASGATETLRTELAELQRQATEQTGRHAEELLLRESNAETAIRDAIASEKMAAAETLSGQLASQVDQLRSYQEEQCRRLEAKTDAMQSRLEAALCSEASLKAKLESAQALIETHLGQSKELRAKHDSEVKLLTWQLSDAQSASMSLNKQQQTLQSSAKQLETQRDEIAAEIDVLQATSQKDQGRIAELTDQLEQQQVWKTNAGELESRREELLAEIATLKSQTQGDQVRIAELTDQLEEQQVWETNAVELESRREELVAEIATLKSQTQGDQVRIVELTDQLEQQQEWKTNAGELESRRDELVSEIETLKSQTQGDQVRIAELTDQLEQQQVWKTNAGELESRRDELVAEIATLKTQTQGDQVRIVELTDQLEQQQEWKTNAGELESRRDELVSEIETLKSQTQGDQVRIAELTDQLEQQQVWKTTAGDLESQRDTMIAEMATLQAEQSSQQQLVGGLTAELEQQKDLADQDALWLRGKLGDQRDRVESIKQELVDQCRRATSENGLLRQQLADLSQQNSDFQSQIQRQTSELQVHTEAAEEHHARVIQERDQALEGNTRMADELVSLQSGHDALTAQCDRQMQEIESLLTAKQALCSDRDSNSKSLNAQTAELMRISAKHENLVKQSQLQSAQITSLLRENEQLAADRVEAAAIIGHKSDQLCALMKTQDALVGQLQSLTSQVKTLVVDYEASQSDLSVQSQQIGQQKAKIEQLQDLHSAAEVDLRDQQTQYETLQAEKSALESLSGESQSTLLAKQEELTLLETRYADIQQVSDEQTQHIAALEIENERLINEEAVESESLSESLKARILENERLREAHEAIRAQSVEQADKIMRLINENQRMSRADRMRAQELTERKSELVHLRDAVDDLKLNSDLQTARIDHLINEKRQLIREKTEAEALGFANLQAAASDYERLQAEKQTVDEKLKGFREKVSDSREASTVPIDRGVSNRKPEPEPTDDLTRIEGIGPKIQQLLGDSQIKTYEKLGKTSVDQLHQILLDAGGRYHLHDPSTWPDQAQLAAVGNWKKLVRLQDSLVGGRRA